MPKEEDKKEEKVVHTKLKSAQVDDFIEVCLCAPMDGYPGDNDVIWGLPVLNTGEPGIAKTARMRQLAKVVHVSLKTLFAGQHPPEDFSGALIPDGKGGASQICALPQIRDLVKDGVGILHLDEINGAPPATQGALQSLVHERHVGDLVLPGTVRIIASQNPEEIATGGYRMGPALANRFMHVTDPGPTHIAWAHWLSGKESKRVSELDKHQREAGNQKFSSSLLSIQDVITQDWPQYFPVTQALFAGFMQSLGADNIHRRPNLNHTSSSKAWPSHRTWDYAARAYTTARILMKGDDIVDYTIEAAVGPGAAKVFHEYRRKANIPLPMDVLNGKWEIDKDRFDILFAATTGAAAYVKQRTNVKERHGLAIKLWAYLEKLVDARLNDFAMPVVQMLADLNLGMLSNDQQLMAAANKVMLPLRRTDFFEASKGA